MPRGTVVGQQPGRTKPSNGSDPPGRSPPLTQTQAKRNLTVSTLYLLSQVQTKQKAGNVTCLFCKYEARKEYSSLYPLPLSQGRKTSQTVKE